MTGPPRLVPLHRNADFRLLWVSQALSRTGSAASLVAFPLLVLGLSGSAVAAGLVGTVGLAVRLACRLPGGALADRWNRRATLLGCDALRALDVGFFGIGLLTGWLPWWTALFAVTVEGAASVLFEPAENAVVRHLVPREQRTSAIAANGARMDLACLLGPPLGGALYGLARAVPFVFDAVSYAVSFVLVLRIRGRLQGVRRRTRPRLAAEIAEGVRTVLRDPVQRCLAIAAALVNCALTGAEFLAVVGLRQHGWSGFVIGGTYSAMAVAGVLGAVAAPWVLRRLGLRRVLFISSGALVAAFLLAAPLASGPLLVVPIATAVALLPAVNAGQATALIARTPERLQARATSVVMTTATTLPSIAPLVAGGLLDRVGSHLTMAAFAVPVAAALGLVLTSRGIRRLGRSADAGTTAGTTRGAAGAPEPVPGSVPVPAVSMALAVGGAPAGTAGATAYDVAGQVPERIGASLR